MLIHIFPAASLLWTQVTQSIHAVLLVWTVGTRCSTADTPSVCRHFSGTMQRHSQSNTISICTISSKVHTPLLRSHLIIVCLFTRFCPFAVQGYRIFVYVKENSNGEDSMTSAGGSAPNGASSLHLSKCSSHLIVGFP